MHGVDFLYQYATSSMNDELLTHCFIPASLIHCACCGRISSDWLRPEAVVSHIYRRDVVHCIACYSLFHGSKKYLGIERGEGDRAIPGKLGMLATCALLVTKAETVIFTGENYAKKLAVAQSPFFSLRYATGFAQTLLLLDLDPEPPFLFIADLGRKKEALVANLQVTTDARRWFICSAKEQNILMPNTVKNVFAAIQCSGFPDAVVSQWLDVLWRVATGGIAANDRRVVELSERLPAFRRDILPLLPNDPYQRIDSLRIVQRWIEDSHERV